MATDVRFVEINETGREMTPEERAIAGELMTRFIKRDSLAKPHSKDLFFLVTDYYMSLMYMRPTGSQRCINHFRLIGTNSQPTSVGFLLINHKYQIYEKDSISVPSSSL